MSILNDSTASMTAALGIYKKKALTAVLYVQVRIEKEIGDA